MISMRTYREQTRMNLWFIERREISSVQDKLQENRRSCLFCAEGGDTLHGICDMTVEDKITEMAKKI